MFTNLRPSLRKGSSLSDGGERAKIIIGAICHALAKKHNTKRLKGRRGEREGASKGVDRMTRSR